MKILLLNGPPGCGKDTVKSILKEAGYDFFEERFADPVKDALAAFFRISRERLEELKKEDPRYRQAHIGLSEDAIKPIFGQGFFGRMAGCRIIDALKGGAELSKGCIADCGFQKELEEFLAVMGYCHTYDLWRIVRPGCSFDNDSREWVELDPLRGRTVTIQNDEGLVKFKRTILNEAKRIGWKR